MLVDPAAEAVEAEAERCQARRDVPVLRLVEHAPEEVVGREVEGGRLDRAGDQRVGEAADQALPAGARRCRPPARRVTACCIAPRSPRRIRRISASWPARDPAKPNSSSGWSFATASPVAATSDGCRRLGRDRGRGPGNRRGLEGAGLVAGRERLARRDARLVGALGGDPRRVRLDGQPLERRREASSRRPGSRSARAVASRVSWLISLISASQDRAAPSTSSRERGPRARVAEPLLGRFLRRPHGARIGGGLARLRGGHVLVVRPLGGAERLGRRVRAGPCPGRDRAALVGDPALVGAGSGVLRLVGVATTSPSSEPRSGSGASAAIARGDRWGQPVGRRVASRSPAIAAVATAAAVDRSAVGERVGLHRHRDGDQGRRGRPRRRGPEGIHANWNRRSSPRRVRRRHGARRRGRRRAGRCGGRARRVPSAPWPPADPRRGVRPVPRRDPAGRRASGDRRARRRRATNRGRRTDRRAWRASGPGSRSGRRSPGPPAAPAGATGGLRSERLRSRHRGPARGPGR